MKPNLGELECGQSRVLIESVTPQVDQGRFPAKRVVGDFVEVRARIFADGHDVISSRLLFRHESDGNWCEVALAPLPNDWWHATFQVQKLGRYTFTVEAWIDRFATWQRDFRKRVAADQDLSIEFLSGARIVREHLPQASGDNRPMLELFATRLENNSDPELRLETALSPVLADLMSRHSDRRHATRYAGEFPLEVDRVRARFSTWYEFFPRSCSPTAGRHGTLLATFCNTGD